MDSDKILAMVEIYPQSAKIIDAHQRLPLHIATKRKANENKQRNQNSLHVP